MKYDRNSLTGRTVFWYLCFHYFHYALYLIFTSIVGRYRRQNRVHTVLTKLPRPAALDALQIQQ